MIQFGDACIGCEQGQGVKQRELERFVQKFRALSSDEIAIAMMVTGKEIFNLLAQTIPCVGCRRRLVLYVRERRKQTYVKKKKDEGRVVPALRGGLVSPEKHVRNSTMPPRSLAPKQGHLSASKLPALTIAVCDMTPFHTHFED